jgi:hypothetical protein
LIFGMATILSRSSGRSSEQWLWPLVFLILTVCGAFLLEGGYAHYEGQFFLVNYLDGRDLFRKIFSAHFNEWDCYQGRELSFFFGWLDAQFIRYSARLGWVHLYSITHFAGLFALALALWDALTRIFSSLERRDAGLIVVLLLTTPTALFSGYYYRPAKILAALFLSVVLLCIGRMREREWKVSALSLIPLGGAATLMGMSDRLGIYLLLLVIGVVIVAKPFDRASVAIVGMLLAALALNVLWSTMIGPRLSAMADGYSPDTVDQIVRIRFTYLRREHYAPALALLADHVKYFFGNFGLVSLIGSGCIAAAVIWRNRSTRAVVSAAVVIVATFAVYIAMYARLTSLIWPASTRVYYWLPQLVVLGVAAGFVMERSRQVFANARPVTTPLLGLLIAGNIISVPIHRAAIRSQEHRPWIEQSATLRECVRQSETAVSTYHLDAPYAQLCGSLRAAAAGTEWDRIPAAIPNPQLYCRFSGKGAARN